MEFEAWLIIYMRMNTEKSSARTYHRKGDAEVSRLPKKGVHIAMKTKKTEYQNPWKFRVLSWVGEIFTYKAKA